MNRKDLVIGCLGVLLLLLLGAGLYMHYLDKERLSELESEIGT